MCEDFSFLYYIHMYVRESKWTMLFWKFVNRDLMTPKLGTAL